MNSKKKQDGRHIRHRVVDFGVIIANEVGEKHELDHVKVDRYHRESLHQHELMECVGPVLKQEHAVEQVS